MSSATKQRNRYLVCFTTLALLALAVGLAFMGTRAAAQSSTTVPPLRHVIFVVGENAGYSQTYGSMPYLDSLAAKYGLATNYVADTHPSIGNYFGLSSGQILSNNDSLTPSQQTFSVDNIALDVQNAGETWKDYVEEDPNVSGCGAYVSGSYYYRHDPLEYYSNINSSNIVCFSQFATDLKNKALPNLSWLVPDGYDDGHDSSPTAFDNWLNAELSPLLSSSYFQPGGDGLLVVTFDEDSNTGGSSCSTSQIESGTWCGGQVETVVISPAIVSAGYQSTNGYHEESILRLMEEALGTNDYPGASANPSGALSPPIDMADFFSQGTTSGTVSVSPTSLTFASQLVGTTSAAQTVALDNGTTSAITVSGIAISGANSGDFAETNTCGTSLAANSTCPISVTFTPSTTSTESATLTVNDSAGSQTVTLSGTGSSTANGPVVSLSPTSLTFSAQAVGTTSATQYVTVSNTGNAPLTLSSAFTITGSFAFAGTGTCPAVGASIAAGGSCLISVNFTPTAAGTFTGAVTLFDNASNSPQTIPLSGTGGTTSTAPAASLSPASLTFASQTVGTTSAGQSVTLSNTGSASLSISGIALAGTDSGDFAETNTCGASVAAGANCSISVTFTPAAAGTLTASLQVTDNATGSPQSVSLTGTGASSSGGGGGGGGGGANNYYVSTTGSDSSGNGTITSPWATIANASSHIGAGAVVHVAAGTYTGSFSTGASGTSSSPITYEADTANFSGPVNCAQVTANHGSLSSCVQLVGTSGTIWYNSGNYVTIEGFDFSGPNIGTDLDAVGTTGSYTRYIGNSVHDIETSGCSSGGDAAIGPNGANGVVDGNYLYNIGAPGCNYTQGIYPNSGSSGTTLIENNVIMQVSSSGIQSWGNSGGDVIVNNTVVNVGTTCIVIGTDTSGQTNGNDFVANNICYATPLGIQEQGYGSSSTGTNNIYEDNLFFNDTTTYLLQNGLVGTGTVSGNPLFVNYTGTPAGDYHLQSTSPAIGTATSTNAPTTDFDGNTRPQNGNWDIGAYEFVGSGGTSGSVTVSPTSLTFPSQTVGTLSTAQVVTLTNGTNTTLSISGVSLGGADSGDFTETNTCGTSLAAAGTCTISVQFSPSAAGTLTATLSVNDNATNSPQTVSLTGTGSSSTTTGPVVSLSPTSVTFPAQAVGTTSSTQYVTLSNTGNAPLTISAAFGITGDFAFAGTGTCPAVGASVAAGGSCLISVNFTPTATGTRTGTITLYDNASNSPQTIPLSGTGGTTSTAPAVTLSPASLTFASQTVGTTSAAQAVTLSNTGNASLSISGIALTGADSGDFAETNTCGSSLAASSSCSISVTFTPAAAGTLTASLAITDNAAGSPQSVGLTGTGASSSGGGGTPPAVSLSPTSLNFGKVSSGQTSPPQTVTVSNTGGSSLSIAGITTTGPFSVSANTCGSSLAAGASCQVSVVFTPAGNRWQNGTLAISDNASGSPQTVSLSGH